MPRQAKESSGTGFTAPVGEIDWDWEKHDISHVTKQVPVPVFLVLSSDSDYYLTDKRVVAWMVMSNSI